MAVNLKLRTIGLPPNIVDRLANQSILTIHDFLALDFLELQRKTGLTYQKLSYITKTVHGIVAPQPVLASQLAKSLHIPLQDKLLDSFLQGGIKCGQITEFSGAPGLGKTQLCLQLALSSVIFNTQRNGVLYIDTEGAFSASRAMDIALSRYQLKTDNRLKLCLESILVWRPESLKDLMEKLGNIELCVIKKKIGLILVDSMGSIVRRQYGADMFVERSEKMCSLSSSLKTIAHLFNLAVVVTNHVTAKGGQLAFNESSSEQSHTVPALGPSWSHWINSRLHFFVDRGARSIKILKSPELPEVTIKYTVTNQGIEAE